MGAGALAIAVLQALPALMNAGANVIGVLSKTNTAIASGDPTQAEWDEIHAEIKNLQAQLKVVKNASA